MFTLRRARIETDQGFAVELTRERLAYVSTGRTLLFNHEFLVPPKSIAIWRNSLREMNPDENLSDGEASEIQNRVVDALRGVGYSVEVI